MKKTNENASMGAVGAGNIGVSSTGSANAIAISRVKEIDGDEDTEAEDMKLNDEDIVEGMHVEFERNDVPYAGRVVEVFERYVVISTAGRRMQVERSLIETALSGLNGAPEPVGPGPTKYGVRTAKHDHAQSSPTTPDKTMQKFVGGETLGSVGTFETLGQGELPGMQTPKSNFETDDNEQHELDQWSDDPEQDHLEVRRWRDARIGGR